MPSLPRYRIIKTLFFVALIGAGLSAPARAASIPVLHTAQTSIPPVRASTMSAQATSTPPFPYADTFKLHSASGAQRVIYLDFNGETISGTVWNDSYTSGNPFTAIAFDTDGNAASFSDAEMGIIQEVWQRVAEDFAPFAVDVTTEDPGLAAIDRAGASDAFYGTRALITDTSTGADTCGCAGVSYVGSYPVDSGHQFYQPALIFGKHISSLPKDIADVASHEIGHTVGLKHDGKGTDSYYGGHGAWAPIMGVGYYCPLTQFSKGDYTGATNGQDDFAVMQQYGLPLRSDDYGDTTATSLPLDTASSKSGVIGSDADVDVFSFSASGGQVAFTANPAPKGPNLDLKLELLDAAGAIVASDNPPSAHPSGSNADYVTGLAASVSTSVAAGNYFLRVQGVGNGDPTTGYSGYGSVGRYTLAASTPSTSTPSLSVSDPTVSEGNSGATNVTFTVSLSAPAAAPVSVNVGTANGTGLAGSDYTAASGVVTIPAGQTSAPFTVNASGDTAPEPHEKFSLMLSNPTGATIADATGAATLANDDGVGISISDVSKFEGASGTTTTFTFTVSLSTIPSWAIGMTVKTVFGTALASDYTSKTQLLSLVAGQKTKTFSVTVKGDGVKEANETFYVSLTAPTGTGAKLIDAKGIGTIKNDD